MGEQLAMALEPPRACALDGHGDLYEAWLSFHLANPHVYARLRDGALRLHRRGWKHYGLAALYEGLRFEAALETTAEVFKLNNNHRAFYARLLMLNVPELAEFFEVREQRNG